MNALKKKQKNISDASARVVDGKLILSLPDAENPVVWQMDLNQTKASALEVLHNEEKALYTLTLKTPKGETVDIAPFKDKAHAVEGLMAASAALESAQGQINTTAIANDGQTVYTTAPPHKKKGKKWLIVIGSLILLFILFNIWVGLNPVMIPPPSGQAGNVNYNAPSTAPQPPQTGVPMSADDFLRAN